MRRKLDLDRPVEPAVLEECLSLALQAPTPGNVQAWRWLVVRDQGVKARLGAVNQPSVARALRPGGT
ncbi:nitroreductase family protein [Amycolatopsis sp. NPDC051128]|uniref:nitroreductase family protein n=1 Tax=Amycolatopsis sp. NPDC051128 TaxID=3155412 RepID=UPI00343C35ED